MKVLHPLGSVGDRLKEARKSLKLNQKDMAEAAGSSFGSWQAYETDKKVPGSQVIAGMVRSGINANWLLTGEGPMLLKELQAQRFDVETLQKAIETLEKGLEITGRVVTNAADKAHLVAMVYDYLTDDSQDAAGRSDSVIRLLQIVR